MGKTFVLSDLHGHYQILLEMLKKIGFTKDDTLFVLGDCCDRGFKSYEIYEYLLANESNIHLLQGNHELMMRDALTSIGDNNPDWRLWNRNGNETTLNSFREHFPLQEEYQRYLNQMIEYLKGLPSYFEVEVNNKKYLLVHAGINPLKSFNENDEEDLAWVRDFFYLSKTNLDNEIVVFGHTPTRNLNNDYTDNIWHDPIYKDKIGIDGGLGKSNQGQLNCLCLDDLSEYVIKCKDVEGE